MGEEVTYSPEQWVEHYQGDYLKTMTIETAGRIIKSDMTNVARSCVSVGFHLKAIRDMELFRDAGYDTLWDYAADQFGISKSSASRNIGDRGRSRNCTRQLLTVWQMSPLTLMQLMPD